MVLFLGYFVGAMHKTAPVIFFVKKKPNIYIQCISLSLVGFAFASEHSVHVFALLLSLFRHGCLLPHFSLFACHLHCAHYRFTFFQGVGGGTEANSYILFQNIRMFVCIVWFGFFYPSLTISIRYIVVTNSGVFAFDAWQLCVCVCVYYFRSCRPELFI